MCHQNTNFTPTSPEGGSSNQRDYETGDLLFLNDSSPINQSDSMKAVEELLPDIINNEDLNDYNFSALAITDGPRSMNILEDESSESGVSMGSSGSPPHVSSVRRKIDLVARQTVRIALVKKGLHRFIGQFVEVLIHK